MEPISALTTVIGLARRFWWVPLLAAAAVYAITTNFKLERARTALATERAAHTETKRSFEKTVADYRTAAAQAALRAKENVERVRVEQARLTEETVNEYKTMAAATADRYRRLQLRVAEFEADTSGASGAGVSLASSAACRAYAGTSCEEIPALLNSAEQNTNQLLALQEWVRAQSKIKNTGVADR